MARKAEANIVSGKKLEDDWGNRIWPRNLTKPWTWRATQTQEINEQERDETIRNIYIYIHLSIGIPGTPMPMLNLQRAILSPSHLQTGMAVMVWWAQNIPSAHGTGWFLLRNWM